MNFLKNMKIGVRLNLILSLVMLISIVALGVYTMISQRSKIIEDTDIRMFEQVDDLERLIRIQTEKSSNDVVRALLTAEEMLKSQGGIKIKGDSEDGDEGIWYLAGENLSVSSTFVDNLNTLTAAQVSIFKKDASGFTRLSTSVRDEKGNRAIGTIIPSNSEVAVSINSGQVFKGRNIILNDWHLTAYSPIKKDGDIIGVIGVGLREKDLTGLRQIFRDKSYFRSGYPFMIDHDGNFVIHPQKEGQNASGAEFFQQLVQAGTERGKTFYEWEGKMKYQYFKYCAPVDAFVSVSIYEEELMDIINQTRNAVILAVLLGILFFVGVSSLIIRSVTSVLKKGVSFAESIAQGRLDQTIDIDQKDEVGQLAKALNNMVKKLNSIVGGISNGSGNIAAASEQMSSVAQQLSNGATEQAASVEEVSSTMEEIASNIQQNTDNALVTEKISVGAQAGINEVSEKINGTVDATRVIADKIQIINDIAFQTNILALNAAVEAARAGEHGKGFAVVASEVRKLAERSKVAADEIVDLAQNSLKVAEDAGSLMLKMLPEVQKNTKLVQEIAASSLEQNNGVDQVNNAIQQLNTITQENASSSEEVASSAEELASQAEQLLEMVSFFKMSGTHERANIKARKTSTVKTLPSETTGQKTEGVNLNLYDEKVSDDEYVKF